MTNEMSGTILELPIRKDIKTAIKDFKVSIQNCVSRLEPFTTRKQLLIATMLPYTLAKYAVYFMTSKVTMIFTNLNASKVPYKLANKEAKSIFIMAQTPGDCNCIILLITMGNKMAISCIGDENILQHP